VWIHGTSCVSNTRTYVTQASLTLTARRYWDEPADSADFASAAVFDTSLGFGTWGNSSNTCVPDGPYAGLIVNIGKGFSDEPRCVNRVLTPFFGNTITDDAVQTATSASTYNETWLNIYSGPHLNGHIALAMMVRQPFSVARSSIAIS
jgi:tyrosinase